MTIYSTVFSIQFTFQFCLFIYRTMPPTQSENEFKPHYRIYQIIREKMRKNKIKIRKKQFECLKTWFLAITKLFDRSKDDFFKFFVILNKIFRNNLVNPIVGFEIIFWLCATLWIWHLENISTIFEGFRRHWRNYHLFCRRRWFFSSDQSNNPHSCGKRA